MAVASESFSSLDHSGSVEPALDKVTGLFSIRPKLLPHLSNNNLFALRSQRLNNFRGISKSPILRKGSSCPRKKRAASLSDQAGGSVSCNGATRPQKSKEVHVFSSKQSGEELEEARATLEVCESVGLFFNADKEKIVRKFSELEKLSKEK
ncbi:hypothetical protein V6N13_089853 [Hibiscus sabdariffa]|uniref:Uncharacterized protein n=1 Tax=Hibiscus sabdariffa TaxID=183260 RepID=A0ABR2QIJ3_9ROSI